MRLWIVMAALVVLLAAPLQAAAGPALVFDAASGKVLHAEDATAPWFPASLTKLMTAYLAFGAIRSGRLKLDQRITCSPRAHGQPPSKLGLPVGAGISVELALKLIIVKSANDVAVMLAEAVSGSVETFAAEMNAAAARLGMTGSRFVNPHGLPDVNQVTTARDMGLLARALIAEYPEFFDWFSLERLTIGKAVVRTHNQLLKEFDGADGMKTGYICASGYNLVASARRGDRRLVAVVLGARSGKARTEAASALLEDGFGGGWIRRVTAPTLAEYRESARYASLPEHMGPAVCGRRYGERDPYEVDERLRIQADARRAAALEKQAMKAATGSTAAMPLEAIPLPPRRPRRAGDPS